MPISNVSRICCLKSRRQLKTLEKQAAKTKKFYELKDEYKNLSLILAKFSLQEYKTQLSKTSKLNARSEDDKKLELETAIKTAEAALEKEKLGNVDKEKNTDGDTA